MSDILTREELLTCLDYWLHDDRVLGPTHAAKILAHDVALRAENAKLKADMEDVLNEPGYNALREENERLAKALEHVRDLSTERYIGEVADTALSGKERP